MNNVQKFKVKERKEEFRKLCLSREMDFERMKDFTTFNQNGNSVLDWETFFFKFRGKGYVRKLSGDFVTKIENRDGVIWIKDCRWQKTRLTPIEFLAAASPLARIYAQSAWPEAFKGIME